jgi:hypothetical protein
MNRLLWTALFLAVSLSAWARPRAEQNADPASAADHTAPSYDMKGQSLVDLAAVQKKFVELAEAVPAEKFTWRPSADSRSFAEVFCMWRANATEFWD